MKRHLFYVLLALFCLTWLILHRTTAYAQTCNGRFCYGLANVEFEFDGEMRHYLIYVPESLDFGSNVPLVLSLHGFGSNARYQMLFSQWNTVAEQHEFIVVYPQGAGLPSRWSSGQQVMSFLQDRDDIGFIQEVITQVSENYPIDRSRIYINGLSNGGGMTNRLACEMADSFAAVGMVAGAYTPTPNGCSPSRPISIIAFHGTADRTVPYEGGQVGGFDLPDVQRWAREWAERNGCNLNAETIPIPEDVDYSGIRYTNCEETTEVILYTIQNGGHTWPGGGPQPELIVGKTSQDINASAIMWEFFSRYALGSGN